MEPRAVLDGGGYEHVRAVVDEIIAMLSPRKIYMYSKKDNAKGEITSFKLCVVAPLADKQQAELEIYREIDSDIPFDVLIYTPEEWALLSGDPTAFANHIHKTGMVVYE